MLQKIKFIAVQTLALFLQGEGCEVLAKAKPELRRSWVRVKLNLNLLTPHPNPLPQGERKYSVKKSGFSLIEAMVATLIMAITFTGVYTLTNYSSITLKNSVDRQKMQLIANQIIEGITIDFTNIDSYNNMDFTTCNAPTGAQTQQFHQNRFRWCQMLNDAVGTSVAGDTRNIIVTTASGKKTLHITLESRRKASQVVIKNAYE